MATTVSSQASCMDEPHAAPASRASWCGQLRLGTVSIPVKAYAAIATPPEVPLRQLHAGCGERIEYRKWCPKHGAVPAEEIVKGYPYQPDQYVELSESELEHIQPTDEKTIHLEHFLDPSHVDLVLLAGRSLYLAPANPAARRPFATVLHALKKAARWAIGRVVFSGRQQMVVVRPAEHVLLVHTLHHPVQRRPMVIGEPSDTEVNQQDLRPILRLIEAANGAAPWQDYQDDWESRLTKLVEAKVAAAQSHRRVRSNGKGRQGAERPGRQAEEPTARPSSAARRKAA